MNKRTKQLIDDILDWYAINARDLPWRKTHSPYCILVSEIMLQQTQVDRVVPKYTEFLRTFPNIKKLAEASAADVIRLWKGLGYNRRALYLHNTAKAIRDIHGGRFSRDLDALKSLPGVGDYTARAILSFAFNQRVPVIDTNHRKFYARVFFEGRPVKDTDLLERAQAVVDVVPSAYDWNQALMDFMSAVASRSTDPIVQTFDQSYPAIEKKKVSKPSVRFEQTDRYVRGRIMDLLRAKNSQGLGAVRKKFAALDDIRWKRIIAALERDGLINIAQSRIVLPS